jgi:hypothetical protein
MPDHIEKLGIIEKDCSLSAKATVILKKPKSSTAFGLLISSHHIANIMLEVVFLI